MNARTDIAIIGSGFAGSLCALLLSKAGFDVVLIDKATHPRFAIGESSTPAGNLILRDLAEQYDLPRLIPITTYGTWQDAYPHLDVGRKRGFSYFAHAKHEPFVTNPFHSNELLVAASKNDYHSDTQWFREDVDAFLCREVQSAAIPFFDETIVHNLSNDEAWRISCSQRNVPLEINARFLIDATGRGGLLAQHFQLQDQTHLLQTNTQALYTHLDGLPTWHEFLRKEKQSITDHPFHCDDSAVHHLLENGWIWMLRFNSGRTSTGIVQTCTPGQNAIPSFSEIVKSYPSLAKLFSFARMAPTPGAWTQTGRIQYLWDSFAGPNWAMLPNAGGFIDPLHSTGIAHSISRIERLISILQRHINLPSLADALSGYSQDLKEEFLHIDRLVSICYKAMPNFELLVPCLMLYFASAITYEEDRLACSEYGNVSQRLFLCAEDTQLRAILETAYQVLQDYQSNPFSHKNAHSFSKTIEDLIEPFNTAGLFSPLVPNMYEYTATV